MAAGMMSRPFVSEKGDRVLVFSQDTGRCIVGHAASRELLEWLVGTGLGGEPAESTAFRGVAPPSRKQGLSSVYLHLTNRCNLTCTYCYNAAYRVEHRRCDELTTAEFRRCLDEISAAGATQVVFTGGEPLLRRDCPELAQHARELGLEATLLTNGTRLHDNAERIAKVFDTVIVSLDSWRPDEHDRVRGKGSFDAIVRGVRHVVAVHAADVYIRAVVTTENVRSLAEFPRYAAAHLGCTQFMLAPCLPVNAGDEAGRNLSPEPREYLAALDAFHRALDDAGGTSNYEAEPFRSDGSCGAGSNVVSIAPNGDVFPCQCLHLGDLCAGNLRDLSLERILQTATVASASGGIAANTFRACAECPVSSLCSLKCRAFQTAFRDDEQAFIERLCPVAHAEIENRLWSQADRVTRNTPAEATSAPPKCR